MTAMQMDLGHQLGLHRAGVRGSSKFAAGKHADHHHGGGPRRLRGVPASTARHLDYRNSPAYGAYEVAMMKRSLDLADQVGVDLRGVLTWAFTFPGTPYFAGHRALSTNGIHLPVLNAFKLLAALRGARLPVTSNGARPLDDLLENGVRAEPDVDALAAIEGRSGADFGLALSRRPRACRSRPRDAESRRAGRFPESAPPRRACASTRSTVTPSASGESQGEPAAPSPPSSLNCTRRWGRSSSSPREWSRSNMRR